MLTTPYANECKRAFMHTESRREYKNKFTLRPLILRASESNRRCRREIAGGMMPRAGTVHHPPLQAAKVERKGWMVALTYMPGAATRKIRCRIHLGQWRTRLPRLIQIRLATMRPRRVTSRTTILQTLATSRCDNILSSLSIPPRCFHARSCQLSRPAVSPEFSLITFQFQFPL